MADHCLDRLPCKKLVLWPSNLSKRDLVRSRLHLHLHGHRFDVCRYFGY